MNQGVWRKWHRWVGVVAAPFLLYAAITGLVLAATEFFGEEEAERERLRTVPSPVVLPVPPETWIDPMTRAMSAAAGRRRRAPVDKVTLEFKGDPPTVIIYTGRPDGGEDRKFIFNARTGDLQREDAYVDKPFLVRLHSGEAWGDGGLVAAMFWAAGLIGIVGSGVVIYFKMRRPNRTGLGRVFWLLIVGIALTTG